MLLSHKLLHWTMPWQKIILKPKALIMGPHILRTENTRKIVAPEFVLSFLHLRIGSHASITEKEFKNCAHKIFLFAIGSIIQDIKCSKHTNQRHSLCLPNALIERGNLI
ncbi:hypothetical protein ASD22_16105 [Rhodanobacter sp. Root480]|nr:hypothetical protein ASD22_16105 [Rhodanobacter sp. Root480]